MKVVRLDLPGHGMTLRKSLGAGAAHPDSNAFADIVSNTLFALEEVGVVGPRPVLLAHSLGGEVAATLAARSVSQSAQGALSLGGCTFISPVALRPHRALTMGNKRGVNLTKYTLPLLRSEGLQKALAPLSWVLFVYLMGFPKRIAGEEYTWMWYRAAIINFEQQAQNLTTISEPNAGLPLCLFFGGRDPLMEPSIHEEVEQLWVKQCGPLRQTAHRVVRFDKGTHYTIKSHAAEIAEHMHDWISSITA